MIIRKTETGEFEVLAQDGSGRVLGTFPTNAAAWRFIDRHEGQPVSRSEATGIFIRERNGGIA